MFVPFNPNPNGIYADDCLVRSISLITGKSWDSVYFDLCLQGLLMKNMPSVNKVWGNYLRSMTVDIFNGCCQTVAVRNTSDQAIQVQNANIRFSRPDLLYSR